MGNTTAHGARGLDLTNREHVVLAQLATHRTYEAIARELFISLNTVKSHVFHVYAKLGVTRRADAVERAITLGLIAPSVPSEREPARSFSERGRAVRETARATCARSEELRRMIAERIS